jgi:ATP-dependent DNA ligase
MLLLAAESLPEGQDWTYESKLDGYRALAIKTKAKVQLLAVDYSRVRNKFVREDRGC